MRAVGKKGGSCFVRFGLHDGVAADVVFDIGNTTFRCLFGLPDRRTRVYKTRHILLHPQLPLPHTLLPVLRTCARHHLPHFSHVHSVQRQEFFHAISPLLVIDVYYTPSIRAALATSTDSATRTGAARLRQVTEVVGQEL